MTSDTRILAAALAALFASACAPQGTDRPIGDGNGRDAGAEEDMRAPVRPIPDTRAPDPVVDAPVSPDLRADAPVDMAAGGDTRPDGGAVDARPETSDARADTGGADQASPAPRFAEVFEIMITAGCPGCHDGFIKDRSNLSGTEQAVYNNIVNKAPSTGTSACRSQLLVVPGKPEQSLLYQLVIPNGMLKSCARRMPPTDEKLPAAELELIRRWIAGGALR